MTHQTLSLEKYWKLLPATLIIKITISKKEKNSQATKESKFYLKNWQRIRKHSKATEPPTSNKGAKNTKDARTLVTATLWLVDLNYSFECDWLIELFDNNLETKWISEK